jgi:hypothetical protein
LRRPPSDGFETHYADSFAPRKMNPIEKRVRSHKKQFRYAILASTPWTLTIPTAPDLPRVIWADERRSAVPSPPSSAYCCWSSDPPPTPGVPLNPHQLAYLFIGFGVLLVVVGTIARLLFLD